MFLCLCFSVIIFLACKYLNAISFITLPRAVRFTFMVYFQTAMLECGFTSQSILMDLKVEWKNVLAFFPNLSNVDLNVF